MAKNEMYNAFCKAGLNIEARTLSETVKGKIVPAIGHYVALHNSVATEHNEEMRVAVKNVLSNYIRSKINDLKESPNPIPSFLQRYQN